MTYKCRCVVVQDRVACDRDLASINGHCAAILRKKGGKSGLCIVGGKDCKHARGFGRVMRMGGA